MTLSGYAQGSGVVRSTARKTTEETEVSTQLYLEIAGTMQKASTETYTVVPWTQLKDKPVFKGGPIGLAVTAKKTTLQTTDAPKVGLLTTEGLWVAEVGEHDEFDEEGDLVLKFTEGDKFTNGIAIAALDNKFVVLQQPTQTDLQVALYNSNGRIEIRPLDLKPLMSRYPTVDLVVYRDRAYVVVESMFQTGLVRSAFSVGFNTSTQRAESRNEFLLECLSGCRLVTFDNALFALNRDSGHMLRLELKDGRLEAYKAANAIDQQGRSMVIQGQLVPAGRVLVVLSPTSVPSLESLANFGLRNVLPYKNLTPPQDPRGVPQDLVYNPQTNHWYRCGHGVDIKQGPVAIRGGASPRLWLIDPMPNGQTYTLTGASEDLFLPDYVRNLASKPLPRVFNKKREYMFINNSGMEFVPMNETCLKAGFKPFSTTGQVHLTSPIPTGSDRRKPEPIELWYDDTAGRTPTAILRLLAKRGPGVKHEYVLEVTLAGPHFSYGSIAFKRITVDERGNVSVVDVPGKLDITTTLGLIETFPRQLSNGIRLKINNLTPYPLWLLSPDATTVADQEKKHEPGKAIEIKYNTPPFSIYANGMGSFPVDVDFTLPDGIETSPGSEAQKLRIRIRCDATVPFVVEPLPVQKTNEYDAYEFTLRYKSERVLNGAFLGDGVASHDGTSLYVPLVEPPNVRNAKILKIDANNLQTTAQIVVNNVKSIFSCPNSVAVLSDVVVGILDGKTLSMWDPSLRPQREYSIQLFEFDVVTNLKHSSGNGIFMLGMKETPTWPCKRSYKTEGWHFAEHPRREFYGWLSFFKGFRPGRVPDAPTWVGLNTISPMDVRAGAAFAVCVEGGIIGQDIRNNWNSFEIELPGTGRQEAILMDPKDHVVFCAHSKPPTGATGLMISRINLERASEKLTKDLPGPVTHVVTDPSPPTEPKLDYYRPRAVSLLATSDTLFVSHSMKIYVLDKATLAQRQIIPVDLPTRLIQVRRGKPPGDNHDKYGGPQECNFLWAIGSRYVGDGQNVNAQGEDVDTKLYKIAVLP
jgi:hypothetical protein